MADVFVTFGGDVGALEAASAAARAHMQATARDMKALAQEFSRAGAAADSEMGQKLKGLGDQMAEAKKRAAEISDELRKIGGGANDNFKNLSGDFKRLTESVANNAYELGPWSGTHVEMAKLATLGFANALGAATLAAAAFGAVAMAAVVGLGAAMASLGERTAQMAGEFAQTTESIGALGAVAGRVGLETKDLGKSLADLKKAASETDKTDDDFKKVDAALKALGMTIDQVKGKNFQQILRDIADASARAGESANKTAALEALLGEEVAEKLAPALREGGAAMDALSGKAAQFGAELGGEMVEKMRGTSEAFRAVGNAAESVKQAFIGLGVALYDKFKPAIDGIVMVFADLIENVASAVNWFREGIGQAGALGLVMDVLAAAVKGVATALAIAVAGFEIFVTVGSNAVSMVANLFVGLAKVVTGFAQDMAANASAAFTALVTMARETVNAIGQGFANLATVIGKALTGDFAAAGAAFEKLKGDASGAADRIASAFNMPGLQNTSRAMGEMTSAIGSDWKSMSDGIVKVSDQARKQVDTIWGAPIKKAGGKGAVGDPSVDDEKGGGKGAQDAAKAALAAVEGEIQALRAGLEQKKQIYATAVKLKLMSEQESLAATKQAVEQEYQAEKALLQKELEIDNLKPQQRQQILNKIQALENRHQNEMFKLAAQSAEKTVQTWHQMIDSMSSSLSSSISGMITGTKKFADAMRDLAKTIIDHFVKMGVTMIADWAKRIATKVALTASGEGQMLAVVEAGEASRTAAQASGEAAGLAMRGANMVKSIVGSSAESFAGVFGFLSPIMGPAAAGPAAAAQASVAAMAGSVALFDIGAWRLDRDQLAYVHKNEMVMPAAESEAFRSFLTERARGGSQAAPGSAGSAPNVHINLHASAVDARGLDAILKERAGTIARAVSDHWRLNPSVRPA